MTNEVQGCLLITCIHFNRQIDFDESGCLALCLKCATLLFHQSPDGPHRVPRSLTPDAQIAVLAPTMTIFPVTTICINSSNNCASSAPNTHP
jgi:hypothetical protein